MFGAKNSRGWKEEVFWTPNTGMAVYQPHQLSPKPLPPGRMSSTSFTSSVLIHCRCASATKPLTRPYDSMLQPLPVSDLDAVPGIVPDARPPPLSLRVTGTAAMTMLSILPVSFDARHLLTWAIPDCLPGFQSPAPGTMGQATPSSHTGRMQAVCRPYAGQIGDFTLRWAYPSTLTRLIPDASARHRMAMYISH